MTAEYLPLLAGLIMLLVGLAVGKAWERYKLREGRWIDRRRARESPHYILGLNFLVSNQLDPAIRELGRAADHLNEEALEIDMILGNLYREKGQVGRAIQIHQGLLQRPKLSRLEQAYVQLCLGLDYRRGGFVDRAVQAFHEVLRLDPHNRNALTNLEKLHEEQHQWQEAYEIRQHLLKTAEPDERRADQSILAFLEHALGEQALQENGLQAAAQRFEAAIALDARTAPAYLHLGDVRLRQGRPDAAIAAWERLVEAAPERAHLAFERLRTTYPPGDRPARFAALCRRLFHNRPQDWRARLALARELRAHGDPAGALDLLFDALLHNPHALSLHEEVWRTLIDLGVRRDLVDRYIEHTDAAVFYLDPHVCVRCHYRSTELLWQCPHCHDWNTFVEERIAPAKDAEETGS